MNYKSGPRINLDLTIISKKSLGSDDEVKDDIIIEKFSFSKNNIMNRSATSKSLSSLHSNLNKSHDSKIIKKDKISNASNNSILRIKKDN